MQKDHKEGGGYGMEMEERMILAWRLVMKGPALAS